MHLRLIARPTTPLTLYSARQEVWPRALDVDDGVGADGGFGSRIGLDWLDFQGSVDGCFGLQPEGQRSTGKVMCCEDCPSLDGLGKLEFVPNLEFGYEGLSSANRF